MRPTDQADFAVRLWADPGLSEWANARARAAGSPSRASSRALACEASVTARNHDRAAASEPWTRRGGRPARRGTIRCGLSPANRRAPAIAAADAGELCQAVDPNAGTRPRHQVGRRRWRRALAAAPPPRARPPIQLSVTADPVEQHEIGDVAAGDTAAFAPSPRNSAGLRLAVRAASTRSRPSMPTALRTAVAMSRSIRPTFVLVVAGPVANDDPPALEHERFCSDRRRTAWRR